MADVDPRDDSVGVRAARQVQLEIWTILGEFRDALTVVGGSAPPYIVEEPTADPYVGAPQAHALQLAGRPSAAEEMSSSGPLQTPWAPCTSQLSQPVVDRPPGDRHGLRDDLRWDACGFGLTKKRDPGFFHLSQHGRVLSERCQELALLT